MKPHSTSTERPTFLHILSILWSSYRPERPLTSSLRLLTFLLLFLSWTTVLYSQDTEKEEDRPLTTAERMKADYELQLDTTQSQEERSYILGQYSSLLLMIGEYEKSFEMADSTYAIASALESDSGLMAAHFAYLSNYRHVGDYEQALYHSRKWMGYMKKSGYDSLKTGAMYNVLGMVQINYGLYHNALDTLQIALELLEGYGNPYTVPSCLDNISRVYSALGDVEQQRLYQHQAIESLRALGGNRNLPALLLNTVSLAIKEGRLDQAEKMVLEAEQFSLDKDFDIYRGKVANAYGRIAAARGEHRKALQHFEVSTAAHLVQIDSVQWMRNGYDKAKSYYSLGRYEEALNEMNILRPMLAKEQSEAMKAKHFMLFSKVQEKMGNLPLALFYLRSQEEASAAADSIASLKQARDLEAQFRNGRQKIALLEKDKELGLQSAEIDRKNRRLKMIGMVALGLFLLTLLTIAWYKQRMRNQAQKASLELNQALIESTEEERERIARELHDGTGSLLTGIKLGLDQLRSEHEVLKNDSRLDSTILHVQNVAKEVRRVSHAMAPTAIERLRFEEVVSDLVSTFSQIGSVEIDYATSGDFEGMNKTERLMLYRILQECLNNSFKHADATEISISLDATQSEIEMLYQDDGKGYDPTVQKNGLGLSSIEKRIQYLNGKRTFESERGSGMLLIINFPIRRA